MLSGPLSPLRHRSSRGFSAVTDKKSRTPQCPLENRASWVLTPDPDSCVCMGATKARPKKGIPAPMRDTQACWFCSMRSDAYIQMGARTGSGRALVYTYTSLTMSVARFVSLRRDVHEPSRCVVSHSPPLLMLTRLRHRRNLTRSPERHAVAIEPCCPPGRGPRRNLQRGWTEAPPTRSARA